MCELLVKSLTYRVLNSGSVVLIMRPQFSCEGAHTPELHWIDETPRSAPLDTSSTGKGLCNLMKWPKPMLVSISDISEINKDTFKHFFVTHVMYFNQTC